ncbi:Major_facilitator superfamily protein [Hexamita inflata]|uniref:Lysosomal dipeptide transporter MFSD1 n=1 Tax=Hexamita inflata TaxID=28002 RepID=A0AA86UHW0_9EUKA|nr:Major facilitator superfamily protein [Hexamita inflata]
MRKELPLSKQIVHMLILALMLTPNLMFNASANAMSPQLKAMFDDDNFNNLSYTISAIPQIFSLIFVSILIDTIGTGIVMPFLQIVNILATIFCIVGAYKQDKTIFLIGRCIFGLSGETAYSGQSKLIVQLISKQFHAIAYAFAMAGMVGGEMLAVLLLPINSNVVSSFELIIGLQVLGLLCIIFYSFYSPYFESHQQLPLKTEIITSEQAENQQQQVISFKQSLKNTFVQIKSLSIWYWFIAISRILCTASCKVYDSRSVNSLAGIFQLPISTVKTNIVYQGSSAAIILVLLSLIQLRFQKIQHLAFSGQLLIVLSMLFFIFGNKNFLLAICLTTGIGMGLSISTANALLVDLAGKKLGASAVGFVYSLRYLTITILTPIVQSIANNNQRNNGWLYFALQIVSITFLGVTIVMKIGM